ncbi:hypothetical protein [uncultured Brevundimonas sp.]|uniref:hypothetical protein n=1 Tax=uncultured Brevundimonas sp. TaxID=213418 RepID=UPI00261F3EAB|nr:hypothetical protein [uncultured Brevundimonas sp.]
MPPFWSARPFKSVKAAPYSAQPTHRGAAGLWRSFADPAYDLRDRAALEAAIRPFRKPPLEWRETKPTLEDVFIQLIHDIETEKDRAA